MGGGAEILKLLASEDVDSDQVNLGVTVLASLGGRHVDDLARAALDDDVTVLPQSRALHGVGGRRAGVGGLEGVIMLQNRRVSILRHAGMNTTKDNLEKMESRVFAVGGSWCTDVLR